MLWQSSFWLSIFSLISTAQERLLDQIHEGTLTANDSLDVDVRPLLSLVLRPAREHGTRGKRLDTMVIDLRLLWLWQSSLMLMSMSWVSFLIGYLLYVLTPLINRDDWTV